MEIDSKKCVGCGNCIPVCPMGAIYVDTTTNRSTVNQDACVECYTCSRGMSKERLNAPLVRMFRSVLKLLRLRFEPEPDVCPTGAHTPQDLTWPRIVRRAFSDPQVPHESTGVTGRGTEEVKTNDLTNRVKEGEVGFTIEFGRPGVGVHFRDIQKMIYALAPLPVTFEKKNPVYTLFSDPVKGTIREDVMNEKLLSAILELKTTIEHAPEVLRVVKDIAPTLNTIITIGAATRCDAKGDNKLEPLFIREGYNVFRGKTNAGLGRRPATPAV